MDLKTLISKRGGVKAQMTIFANYLSQFDDDELSNVQVKNIQSRIEKFNPLFDTFNDLQSEIDQLESDMHKNMEEREAFHESYFELLSRANTLIETKLIVVEDDNISIGSASARVPTNTQSFNHKLPRIELPTFNGNFTRWQEYKDSFAAMVHTNRDLTDSQKLNYLKASVKGEPSDMLRALTITDENYTIAFNKLMKRYDNKRRIVDTHIREILNLEPVKSVSKYSNIALRLFINSLENHLQCLEALNQPVDSWDAVLLPVIIDKLDDKTIQDWELKISERSNQEIPKIKCLIEYLNVKQSAIERAVNTRTEINQNEKKSSKFESKKTFTTTITKELCPNCEKSHYLQNCESFLKLNAQERSERVKNLRLCLNCLRKGHYIADCHSSNCKKCNKKHNTLLHIDFKQKNVVTNDNNKSVISCSSFINTKNDYVLLSTAEVELINTKGNKFTLRALLDSGSQSNFITTRACKLLNLKKHETNIAINGINEGQSNITHKTEVKVQSKHNNFNTTMGCLVINKITGNLPCVKINRALVEIPPNIKLADAHFHEPKEIDILIGAGIFYDLLCIGQIKNKGLLYQKTKLGWVVTGTIENECFSKNLTSLHCTLHDSLQRFWKIDEISTNSKILTNEEEFCETVFKETTVRAPDGKFLVKLPLKRDLICQLGESYELAKSRFNNLENKFSKNEEYKELYVNCIRDYERQGHATQLPLETREGFFMPHHGVTKESSDTTKLRVVFDGSCKLQSGIPINSMQCVGPTIQNDIFSILNRFRTHRYVVTGDIAQMYRQVWVHPDDRQYQRILWREKTECQLNSYELNTVTFGTSAAPYLAIRCLFETANINEKTFPEEASIIKRDFYVDDLLTGSNSISHLQILKENLTKILSDTGFKIRKWRSNYSQFNEQANSQTSLTTQPNKTLGIYWSHDSDQIYYSVAKLRYPSKVSKRTILSVTAQLYDPIGLLAPSVIIAKIIIQKLWILDLGWDDGIPNDLHTQWLNFLDDVNHVNDISIPRFVSSVNAVQFELVGFSDASERGYGACVYFRTINDVGEITVNLLAAKSRVAPLKNTTIPRLELLAAVLLAQLMNKIESTLNSNISRRSYFTDSQIVLCWVKAHPNRWVTFVSNRVATIQELSNQESWFHVRSADNPADIISRGCMPSKLKNCSIWWNGPPWLRSSDASWPKASENEYSKNVEIPEEKKSSNSFAVTLGSPPISIENYSNLLKLTRITSYCYRFINNCLQTKTERKVGYLTVKELEHATIILAKITQMRSFPNEYEQLSRNKPINSKSSILSLSPFMCKHGLIRVGGRLSNSSLKFNKKHPIILPKGNHFTELIFRHKHLELLHAPQNLLLNSVREIYWPIAGKNLAKKTVKNCMTCFRYNSTSQIPIMGNLPHDRTQQNLPFAITGVDYAGPILIKSKIGRGSQTTKAYICLFICFSTKAIHLELVTSLSTEAFLATFRRFVSRRGKPSKVYSDNGKNFVGANSELKKFISRNSASISQNLIDQAIEWNFIPAYSPNFGGLWEAGVKSVKHHLKRVISNASLTFEDMYTVLTQIEGVLNSRPLTPMSSDPNDYEVLTPAHFLIGRSMVSAPDPDVKDVKINRLNRYQYLQQLQQHFWARWSTEYISQLQQRQKWKKSFANVKVNQLVLVKDKNSPPSSWKLGRIIQCFPGKDGVIRVVKIKCASGDITRSLGHVCVLPTN